MYTTARVEHEKCNGCKLCITSCPDPNVLIFKDKKVSVDEGRCKGCGLCATICNKKAIQMCDVS